MISACMFVQRALQPVVRGVSRRVPHLRSSFCTSSSRYSCRIMSIDGGGIRGIIPGKILAKIEKDTNRPIARSFNWIGGTSTGGILAIGLSLPGPRFSAKDILKFYTDQSFTQEIFKVFRSTIQPADIAKQILSKNAPAVPLPAGGLVNALSESTRTTLKIKVPYFCIDGGAVLKFTVPKDRVKDISAYKIHSQTESIREYVQPKFIADGIEKVLREQFLGVQLASLVPTEVAVTTFNTSTMKHHVWSKLEAKKNPASNIMAWQAARATSAAPCYFPGFNINGQEHVDGGVCLNNPAWMLVAKALQNGISLRDIFCVSLGTGQFTKPLAPTTHFGKIHWAPHIFDAASAGISSQTDEYLATLFKEQGEYIRINPDLPEDIELDKTDPETIRKLKDVAKNAIEQNSSALARIAEVINASG